MPERGFYDTVYRLGRAPWDIGPVRNSSSSSTAAGPIPGYAAYLMTRQSEAIA